MKRVLVALILSVCGVAVLAEEHAMEVDRFTMVDVGKGVSAKVVCGSSNSVTVTASAEEFDKMTLKAEGGVLKISRGFSFGMVKTLKEKIPVVVTTNTRLSALENSAASELEVAGCAVDKETLEADVKSGATMIVGGSTDKLDLKVGTKASFNGGFHASDLKVEEVELQVSAGGEVGLCKAGNIEGKASTKSSVLAAKDAKMQIKLSSGAEVTHVGC